MSFLLKAISVSIMEGSILIILISLILIIKIESSQNFENITIVRNGPINDYNDNQKAVIHVSNQLNNIWNEICSNSSLSGEMKTSESMYDEYEECNKLISYSKVILIFEYQNHSHVPLY